MANGVQDGGSFFFFLLQANWPVQELHRIISHWTGWIGTEAFSAEGQFLFAVGEFFAELEDLA